MIQLKSKIVRQIIIYQGLADPFIAFMFVVQVGTYDPPFPSLTALYKRNLSFYLNTADDLLKTNDHDMTKYKGFRNVEFVITSKVL